MSKEKETSINCMKDALAFLVCAASPATERKEYLEKAHIRLMESPLMELPRGLRCGRIQRAYWEVYLVTKHLENLIEKEDVGDFYINLDEQFAPSILVAIECLKMDDIVFSRLSSPVNSFQFFI